jgi:hypothetical protein
MQRHSSKPVKSVGKDMDNSLDADPPVDADGRRAK